MVDLPFVEQMLSLRSVSVVGLSKNAGKTETLNYIIRRIAGRPVRVALTSIGIDGERTDQVTLTDKPEILIPRGVSFVTTEGLYAKRELTASIFDLSPSYTALGRLVSARTLIPGKVILSGPPSTQALKRLIARLAELGMELTIVDGALSRLSLASPSVTDGMILATGAAVSSNMAELVRQTAFVYHLISLPQVADPLRSRLEKIDRGVWAIDGTGEVHDLGLPSIFLIERAGKELFRHGHRLYVAGAVSDKVFDLLRMQGEETELIIQDFTRVFASPRSYYAYERSGGRTLCVSRSRLLSVTVNPSAPNGYRLNSIQLCDTLADTLGIPVYDVRRL